ncbi:GNAT family N-acetyltransferase [Pseudonocardia sp. N23]|uniref:GNAT family N-acetyltransferase n=1 Tax=Pseudonocardia sp. N23 TaxID=1987376 RepID=UPI000BFCA62C|nr:GNAT family N-acetyltransferase [Pseudonocardia sp. N23]GAY07998.1 acetyltransferase [Pseudonocardia sp. N23]
MTVPSDVRPGPAAEPAAERVLDNAAYTSLAGPHRGFAEAYGTALRYRPDVSVFAALPSAANPDDWADLAVLAGPGAMLAVSGQAADGVPAGWEVLETGQGVQLVDDGLVTGPDEEAVRLGAADVEEMLALVALTKPGPFAARTVELGTYLGIRRGGALVAMAGERLHPPGWTEISAVCTHPDHRGQGLATRLVRAVGHGIHDRGETPLMHAAASNTNAIRLYLSIGFRLRRQTTFMAVRVPDVAGR